MREVTEAHYLHERHGLEAVLRPPVRHPTALQWLPGREVLVVGTRDGKLHTVDPVMGSRVVAEGVGEPARIAVHTDRKHVLVVARGGVWVVVEMGGEAKFGGKHAFLGGIQTFWLKNHVVMVGDEVDGRTMMVCKGGKVIMRANLPPRTVPLRTPDGKGLLLARSMHRGLGIIKLGGGDRFPKDGESTIHRLTYTDNHILGITPTGVGIWNTDGEMTSSMRLPDLTVGAVAGNGTLLGLGTRSGAVALARLSNREKLVHPDLVKAFEGPVTSIAFSDRGRWLATGGVDRLQLWSWED